MSARALPCCFVVMNSLGVVSIGLVAFDSTTGGGVARGGSSSINLHAGILPAVVRRAQPSNFR